MRVLGVDLGIKSLGIAISDKTNTIATPVGVLFFEKENYAKAVDLLKPIIEKNNITDIALGLPKNMDNSLGFAAQRSMEFAKLLNKLNIEVHLVDERLSTVEATNILKETGNKNIKKKEIVDAVAANIILESYLRGINNAK